MDPAEPPVDDSPNGIPLLGLGTWKNTEPDSCAESVRAALELGYRHIDTAQIYENEGAVGTGIATADVDRDDVFVATKVWIDSLSFDDVIETTETSLERLGVDYVDLLYVHWPARSYDPTETLGAFDELVDRGLTESVGVSNFEPDQLREAIEISDAPIVANQIECHPLLKQPELRAVCDEAGVDLVAYSPLARGDVFDVPELREIAGNHETSPAQVSLAWLRQRGCVAIPKASSEPHIQDNYDSLWLTLSDSELERIDSIADDGRRVDPAFGPWN